jgi:hypothetical protein
MERSILEAFADGLKAKLSLPGAASPEDQLKPLVADLIKTAGARAGLGIETRTETHLSEHKVRPDMAIYVDGLICGYIELKAPGTGADAPKLKGEHNKRQWEKLKALPNLIYTDGREWALYGMGKAREGQPLVRLSADPASVGKKAVTPTCCDSLNKLLQDFLRWSPSVPHKPTPFADYLAPLTRFLRSEIEFSLDRADSPIKLLANEWRQYFFPETDDARFADAYAQTVTYALLLARLAGAEDLAPEKAARTLDRNNGLLARTLELLGQEEARKELIVGFELLKRSLEALNPRDFLKSKPDLWLYFYEDFLAAYDPKLRKDYGVYYTPHEVVELQVRLASELLEKRFGKKLGFADDGVVFLDPAVGTGAYPVAAAANALNKVRAKSGAGAVPARARQMAANMHGFEVLMGPYAVAHLRLRQYLESAINDGEPESAGPEKLNSRLNIYLADTLSSPNKAPPGGLDLTHRRLTDEHEAARKLKRSGDVLVCLGNPPYDRQSIEEGDTTTQRKGGWVRFGDQIKGAASAVERGERPILADFTEPASKAGAGIHLKNLYNDYIYFWRWALWRLFEQQKCGGIVTFITASSYLAGPGFVGVREVMRRTFDDLWIIDLGGDNLGTRKTPNVFNIQTPVAIAIGVRAPKSSGKTPAKVRYAKIETPSRESKLARLAELQNFAAIPWRDCPEDWRMPFLPEGEGDYFSWPAASQLFPWSHSGCELKRSWPIAETIEVLQERWKILLSSKISERDKLFRRTGARNKDKTVEALFQNGKLKPIGTMKASEQWESVSKYGFRSFDRQHVIADARLGDRFRPPLIHAQSDKQVFLTSLQSHPLGAGPAMVCFAHVPDRHAFCGRGGKDVIPLYRDAAGREPNVTAGLLEKIGERHGRVPCAEDLAAYVYALLAGQSYTRRFWNELETPGPRVPLTQDGALFAQASALGRKLIWLHTYAERFRGEGRGEDVPQGAAKCRKGVSDDPARYPETFSYDAKAGEIAVGDGRFGPVSPQVWAFEVSGLEVVKSWLGYRMKKRAGKKSSPLDDIRPERWTARMSDELLELLWVLEATLAMEPKLDDILNRVIASPCFAASDLPVPDDAQRRPPGAASAAGGLLDLMGDGEEDDSAEDED